LSLSAIRYVYYQLPPPFPIALSFLKQEVERAKGIPDTFGDDYKTILPG
jgi:hypothetical protein